MSYYLEFLGDENTADVGIDDHQLLAYHFHIPEGLCGKLPNIDCNLNDALIPTLFEISCKNNYHNSEPFLNNCIEMKSHDFNLSIAGKLIGEKGRSITELKNIYHVNIWLKGEF